MGSENAKGSATELFFYRSRGRALNDDDLRPDPLEGRKATLAMGQGWAWHSTKRAYGRRCSPDWLKMKNTDAPAVRREAEEDWAR
jgi:hypothetical protein